MLYQDFDRFIQESWDYVSKYVVSDEFWNNNSEFIREVTFELYQKHVKSGYVIKDGERLAKFSAKEAGKLLESFFSTLKKYKLNY